MKKKESREGLLLQLEAWLVADCESAGHIMDRGNCSCMTGIEYPSHHLLFISMGRSIQPAPVSINATALSRSAPEYLRQTLYMEMVTT
jgi:hypothetical protein